MFFGAGSLRRVEDVLRFEDEVLGCWVCGVRELEGVGEGFKERFLKSPILRAGLDEL